MAVWMKPFSRWLRMLFRGGRIGVISTAAAALLGQQRLHLGAIKSPDLIA
jgi:hypothetical protein